MSIPLVRTQSEDVDDPLQEVSNVKKQLNHPATAVGLRTGLSRNDTLSSGENDMKSKILYPTPEELMLVERDLPCTEAGCSRVFRHRSALRFHVLRTHRRERISDSSLDALYVCPSKDCQGVSEHTTLKALKQHYLKMHAPRVLSCPTCGTGFASHPLLRAHRAKCGVRFSCDCGAEYSNMDGLKRHWIRTKHPARDLRRVDRRCRQSVSPQPLLPKSAPRLLVLAPVVTSLDALVCSRRDGTAQTSLTGDIVSRSEIISNSTQTACARAFPQSSACQTEPESAWQHRPLAMVDRAGLNGTPLPAVDTEAMKPGARVAAGSVAHTADVLPVGVEYSASVRNMPWQAPTPPLASSETQTETVSSLRSLIWPDGVPAVNSVGTGADMGCQTAGLDQLNMVAAAEEPSGSTPAQDGRLSAETQTLPWLDAGDQLFPELVEFSGTDIETQTPWLTGDSQTQTQWLADGCAADAALMTSQTQTVPWLDEFPAGLITSETQTPWLSPLPGDDLSMMARGTPLPVAHTETQTCLLCLGPCNCWPG